MLEATASFRLTRLLTLDHARIARQETFAPERGTERRIDFDDGSSEAKGNGARLTGNASSEDGHMIVEAVGSSRMLKRQHGLHAGSNVSTEIIVH